MRVNCTAVRPLCPLIVHSRDRYIYSVHSFAEKISGPKKHHVSQTLPSPSNDAKKTEPVKVTLTLGSQPSQKQLAPTLVRRGMLSRVLSFGIELEILDPDGADGLKLVRRYPHYRLANRILSAAWRRLPGARYYYRHFPRVLSVTYADWLISRQLPASDIFHGFSALSLAGLRAAKRNGAVTMIENPTMHPRDWQNIILKECEAFGIRPSDCRTLLPSALIRRMEEEYEICDFIVVPSAIARDSFSHAGYSAKALVVHTGIDHHFFKPSALQASRETFRVCYTGRVELAKGVVYLLQAWKQLDLKNAELVLIGEVAPEMKSLIHRYATPNVTFTGFLPPNRVADWYRDSDVFAFPSVNEGLARVLLEAMAAGLPVVATRSSGAEDCVTTGEDGTIVPARDAGALAEAILWHSQNREATKVMGKAARAKIEAQFTVSKYEERMIRVYNSSTQPASDIKVRD
jgi:glycosyltransferase involved in cell wall biosynthesis